MKSLNKTLQVSDSPSEIGADTPLPPPYLELTF